MLEYEFRKNEIGRDCLHIKGKLEGLNELASCSVDYLEEIVCSLKKIIDGELDEYDFGFEIYSIECTKETCKVIDTYEEWKEIAVIGTPTLYQLMLDIRQVVISNTVYFIDKCLFFDGVKTYVFKEQHFDWLYSSDYSVWSNSYVEIHNKRIYIIQENVKVLSTFKFYEKAQLELLVEKYNLKIKEENNIYYAYYGNHTERQFQVSENEQLIVIYCLEGERGPESIFIYKVIEK
ncbi:hypothetical protein [Flavobacterium hungaricum]|uniref:Uncharacterized protein n=1 Tax=Flavobacterium hungaricum TaxID=2082725 RepID=A0ABR9TDZ2_9FLAO|nr:hypothetical protein [Flavobacterium hungaricum]MBE8723571.1 hypothetical protein [Flavobacterium hungaricum]